MCTTAAACLPAQMLMGQSESLSPHATLAETSISTHAASDHGCMLLCGGSLLPKTILDAFHERGGGVQGQLVIIPTASPRSDLGDFTFWKAMWNGQKWNSIHVVHALNKEAASNEPLLDSIRSASAVWIAGGDQQRLVDRYLGTPVHTELQNVLNRGGIIGGTSAGAAIASRTMIAGGVTLPTLTEGWSLLPGTIIDQHFSQRGRFERLAHAVERFPDRVGIGIDEATGILLNREGMRVLGSGSVYLVRSQSNKDFSHSIPAEQVGLVPMQFECLKTSRHKSGSRLPIDRWNRIVTRTNNVEFTDAKNE